MADDIAVTAGSRNVYEDLGYPDADERLVKAALVSHILDVMEELGLTQAQVAERLGTQQPKISRLVQGDFRGFSVGRLIRYLNALDRDVEIVIRDKPQSRERGRTTIAAA